MPRQARTKSNTGIYHVVMRGINQQRIFEDHLDYRKFLDTIGLYKDKSGYELYAYCLMGNHIHLLIREGDEDLGNAFRRIGAAYVYWYNWKYNRCGHLFQDRFKSEAVETDAYLLTVLRYIHQNPLKAGMVKKTEEYQWSSYHEYVGKAELCDTEYALKAFSEERPLALNRFQKFHLKVGADNCLEYSDKRLNDTEAAEVICRLTGDSSPQSLQRSGKEERSRIIQELRQNKLSIRQIQRLTGISIGVIRGAGS